MVDKHAESDTIIPVEEMVNMTQTYQQIKEAVLRNRAAKAQQQTNEDAAPAPAQPTDQEDITLTGTPAEIIDELFRVLDSDA